MAVAAYALLSAARVAGAAALLTLSACTSTSSSDGRRAPAVAPTAAPSSATPDASSDWHGLVLVPFGTLLKESPIALHEVLLFHDASPGAADVDSKDCFAIDGTPPRFVGQPLDQYLLCFDHDRLNRVEAAVHLAAAEAAQVFARACALWLKSPASAVANGTTCEGRDGNVAFSARLGLAPGEQTAPLSITLSTAPVRDAARDAAGDTPREGVRDAVQGAGRDTVRETGDEAAPDGPHEK
jgi:hypothetical protein